MPQIEFQPPLATTTTVGLPPLSVLGSAESHVTLSFTARPIEGLLEDDTVEIWTDGGTPGSWRAVPFERYDDDGILVAQIPVGIAEGSFGFTYRVTHATGDATWLGDMGGNGKIDLVSAEGQDALWKGEDWLKLEKEQWTGFGIQLDENKLPSGVEITGESVALTFAYLHPSAKATPPFATFHPTNSSSITSTAFGLLATTESILSSTSTSILSPIAQSSESTQTTGPPAAYASYCGLGFSGGEHERTKAFRSLLGLANHGLQYLPCTGKGDVHAVGILAPGGEAGKPERLITYLAGNNAQNAAEWNLSAVVQKTSGIVLWDAETKHAKTIATVKPTLRLASDSTVVQTLQIVHLFEFSSDGTQTLIGILDDSQSKTPWIYSPERTETEQIFVDEIVSSPAPEKGGKALGETSDSGETVESSGVTSTLDFTSDADNETLGTSVDGVDEETLGKGKTGDADELADVTEEQAPVAPAPVEQETETSEAKEDQGPPTNEPTVTPKKSILRFFWITLSLLNSLWWGTLSWFRQLIGRKSSQTVAPGQGQSADVEDEQTPLIREVDPAQDYASTSQETLQPEITEPVEPVEPEVSQNSSEPPVEPETQVIRVPETRTTVFPAHISAGAVSHDVLLLTNAPAATWLAGEIRGKAGEWQAVTLVQEDVAATSEMKLVRLPLTGNEEAEVRVRLA